MSLGICFLLGWMAFVALTAVAMLIWGWRRKQFHNIEEAKYIMLEDREPEDWPDRKGDES
jgi:nitrogen fixation-related uncharacterized protein